MFTVRAAAAADAKAICGIYNHHIANTVVTFEEEPVSEESMQERIRATADEGLPWLVSMSANKLAGYAYASTWKSRCAYQHSAEVTIYLGNEHLGQGVGTELYLRLMDELRANNYHTALGGVALPNPASVALHEKLGFTKVAQFREVGNKFDQWIDVGYWQLLL